MHQIFWFGRSAFFWKNLEVYEQNLSGSKTPLRIISRTGYLLKPTKNQLILLRQKWSDLKKRKAKGLFSDESHGVAMANVVDALLVIIDQ